MIRIEEYWCEDVPTIEDITQAYELVSNNNIVVVIRWWVNGFYERFITKEVTEKHAVDEFYCDVIPHIYGL